MTFSSFAPVWAAADNGFFSDYGVNVELVPIQSVSASVAALISGSVDVAPGGITAAFWNTVAANPGKIKIVASMNMHQPGVKFVGWVVRQDVYDSGATSLKDLKGYTAYLTRGTQVEYLLDSELEKEGLPQDWVTRAALSPPDSAKAMLAKTGDVKFAALAQPWLDTVVNQNAGHALFYAEDVEPYSMSGVIQFGERLTAQDPELGARWLCGYLKGVAYYNKALNGGDNRQAMVDIIMKHIPGADRSTIDTPHWPFVDPMARIYVDSAVRQEKVHVQAGLVKAEIPTDQWIDPKPLEMATGLSDVTFTPPN